MFGSHFRSAGEELAGVVAYDVELAARHESLGHDFIGGDVEVVAGIGLGGGCYYRIGELLVLP